MPYIVAKCQTWVTRDNPSLSPNAQMATQYSPPKKWAYLSVDKTEVINGTEYKLLRFASPIPVGNKSVELAYVTTEHWSWTAT